MDSAVVYDVVINDVRTGYYIARRNGVNGNKKQLNRRERCLRGLNDVSSVFSRYKRTLSEKRAVRFDCIKFPMGIAVENIFLGYCEKFGDTEFIARGTISTREVIYRISVCKGFVSYGRVCQHIY